MNFSTWPRRLFIVDVEGNGATPPNLVEVAAIPVENGEPQPAAARTWLVRPPAPIPPRITRIHGITNEMVADLSELRVPPGVSSCGTESAAAIDLAGVGLPLRRFELTGHGASAQLAQVRDVVVEGARGDALQLGDGGDRATGVGQ